MFRITFNKPAYSTFFEGENARSVQIKITPQGVMLRASDKEPSAETPDVVPLSERGRGGLSAAFDGRFAEELLGYLKNPSGNAFFMLNRAQDGWALATPFESPASAGNVEPPRFRPHMRVWVTENVRQPGHELSRFLEMGVPQFLTEVEESRKLVAEYMKEKVPGRPPLEVTEAQKVLNLMTDVAYEVMGLNKLDEAAQVLTTFLYNQRLSPGQRQEYIERFVSEAARQAAKHYARPAAEDAADEEDEEVPITGVMSPVARRQLKIAPLVRRAEPAPKPAKAAPKAAPAARKAPPPAVAAPAPAKSTKSAKRKAKPTAARVEPKPADQRLQRRQQATRAPVSRMHAEVDAEQEAIANRAAEALGMTIEAAPKPTARAVRRVQQFNKKHRRRAA